jgi:membrane protein DedA with SNARE-associated domain
MTKAIFGVLLGFCALALQFGYPGVALLMAIESACIPLPSELIMPFAGALTDPVIAATYQAPQLDLWLAGLAGAIGCNLGSEIAYWVGARGGRKAIETYGKYVLMSKHELDIADRWFAKRGEIIVFVSRLLPVIRTFIAFPAGVARMNRVKFHIYTFAGSLPWCLALAYVGQKLGQDWNSEDSWFKVFLHRFDKGIAAIIVLVAVWFVWSRLKARREYETSTP